ncbi:MAG: lytic murein transglycosylase, partial [Ghiorsea sp.]|nr:lytic murein transglycosylase [Ghiorsea sp.]
MKNIKLFLFSPLFALLPQLALGLMAMLLLPSLLFAESYTRDDLIAYMIKETHLPKAYVEQHLHEAKFDADLIRKMHTPYEARPYADYRPLFVNERLKKKSQAFLAKHHDIFVQAQAKYGVAPEVITAILGIETRFGENWGRNRVLDALFTLATGYERRAKFFRKELKAFLILCKEEGLNPKDIEGSYAGAFGVTQLMPTSFLEYAVDGNGDGKRDVWHTPEDIIFSVAYYFSRYHWDDKKMVAHWVKDLPNNAVIKQALVDETRKYK